MIYIFNLIISFICIIPIILFNIFPHIILINYFKNHVIIFIIKLFFISMFIYFFIFNLGISNYKIFIISGAFNLIFFHILEGFLSKKILIKNEIKQ